MVLPGLGAAPLERAEIYFLDGARAMVESGDWLVPRYRGEAFFDKPPLTYWLMALALLWRGLDPAAARLVPFAAALGLVLATAWLGRLLFDRRSGLAGALVLATSLAFVSFARVAMSDMLLALFSTLAAALVWRAFHGPARPSTLPALGGVLGLGFLTKGPIALLLPGLAALLLLLRRPPARPPRSAAALLGGGVAFALVALPWFAAVSARLGTAPLAHFFLRENLERFAGSGFDVGRPVWFYLPAYLMEGLPWSLLVVPALVRLLGGADEPGRSSARFLAAWLGSMLVPLSLSRGKIDYYLLPLYPAVSLLLGRYLVAVRWRGADRWWARGALVAVALGLALVALLPHRLPAAWLPAPPLGLLLSAVAGVAALGCLAAALRPMQSRVAFALAAPVVASSLIVGAFFLPAFSAAQPGAAIVADVRRERLWRPDARLAACSDPARVQREILFHARATVAERCDLWGLAASSAPFLFLLDPAEYTSFRVVPGFREVSRHRHLPATVFTLQGLVWPPQPGETVLGANYSTADPVAERKRRREWRRARTRHEWPRE